MIVVPASAASSRTSSLYPPSVRPFWMSAYASPTPISSSHGRFFVGVSSPSSHAGYATMEVLMVIGSAEKPATKGSVQLGVSVTTLAPPTEPSP